MSSLKRVHVIINPISGTDFPILPHLVRTLNKQKIDWQISITKKHDDTLKFTQQAVKEKVDAVVVYGGDGTVMEVASELSGTKIPMIIIPGGTANVLAQELDIPIDTLQALKVFSKKDPTKRVIDMGVCNKKLFVLRINVGIMADMVKHTPRARKNSLGKMSYIVTGVDQLSKSKISTYTMVLDGKKVVIEGIGLTVANSGNIGMKGFSLSSGVKVDDGILDIMIIQSADVATLASIFKGVMQQKKSPALVRYKVKEAKISIAPKQSIIQDDREIKTDRLDISVRPKSLTVLI